MSPEQLTRTIDANPELARLEKLLKKKYPSHHYNHITVWSRFWALVESMA